MKIEKTDNKAQMKYSGKILRHWYWCVFLVMTMFALTAGVLYLDTVAGCVVGGFTVFYVILVFMMDFYYRSRVLAELMDFAHQVSGVENTMIKELEIPLGLLQTDGKVLWMNDMLSGLTKKTSEYHRHINSLFPELDVTSFPEKEAEAVQEITFEEKKYKVIMKKVLLEEMFRDFEGADLLTEDGYIISIYLLDITELSQVKKDFYEQKSVVGLLYMDNYDEVMDSVEDIRRSMLEALVDRQITKYVSSMGGLTKKMEKDKYLLVIDRKGLDMMEEDRFSVLEEVKKVNLGNSIKMTISLGIGTENGDYSKNYESCRGAMEMALARGGDQVVVKIGDKMSFFGGKTQHNEKNTRVKARVKAQALRELINGCEKVVVMGHKMTDIDSLGACVGVCRAAHHVGKQAYIVLGDVNSNIRPWVTMLQQLADAQEEKLFLTHAQAIDTTNANTAVIVVDTNRPSMVECEELLYLTKSIVVLDHHRQGTENIENAALSYVEPSASSACEMVAEILQYYDDNIKLRPGEADCIYAGIIVDTNNFVAKTGMRTFEAAAFLRRNGADMTRVRKSFRNDMNTYKARAEAVRHAEAYMDSYAISVCPSEGLESPTVVGAQAANELLNIIGVKASFVLTEFGGKVFISARAIDEVNVQIIMERLGGGGHLNIAGAQLQDVDLDGAKLKLKEVLTQMTKEGAI